MIGLVPPDLPDLSAVKQMLIARAHMHMEVKRYRGHQYHYSGHTVCFMQNTAKLYDTLPLIPEELGVLMLRPARSADNPRVRLQFANDFRVRQSRVRQWLLFLQQNYPGYRAISISLERLGRLSNDSDVSDRVVGVEMSAEPDSAPGDSAGQEGPHLADTADGRQETHSMVPNYDPQQPACLGLVEDLRESIPLEDVATEAHFEQGKKSYGGSQGRNSAGLRRDKQKS